MWRRGWIYPRRSNKVRQCLFNLLSNASKFSKNGLITLRALLLNDWLEFEVQDSGIGMTEEQMSKLFQSFSPADASIAGKFGGTGLGLAISQRFCQLMGGQIRVASTPGVGTTFTVRLPVRVLDRKSPAASNSQEPQKQTGAPIVLVIDDDSMVHDLIRRFLSKEGFEVVAALNSAHGLELARQLRPDVITLDAMMPGVDGWTTLRELKADEELRSIPVIMSTVIEDRGLAFSLGASEYLTKPIDRDRLLATVASLWFVPRIRCLW